jgi:hypothetical protein
MVFWYDAESLGSSQIEILYPENYLVAQGQDEMKLHP